MVGYARCVVIGIVTLVCSSHGFAYAAVTPRPAIPAGPSPLVAPASAATPPLALPVAPAPGVTPRRTEPPAMPPLRPLQRRRITQAPAGRNDGAS